jgi:RNase H-like domain found in reverse transcriptase/Reverse transcriptase (RNA-dependent DNA polymerase)/Integrase zinc binding domain/Chromo (CHRromatin Organisation MOdifier) domain/Retroviral aspartyl protease
MEKRPSCALPRLKKRVGEGLERRGPSPTEPQSLNSIQARSTSAHLVLTATLQNEQVRIMVDCGANRSYVSLRLGQKLSSWRQDKDKPYPLTMADGTPVDHGDGWVRQELNGVELNIAGHRERISLDITNIRYDIILGMAWLERHNPEIDWKARVLKFPKCSHGNGTGDGSSPKVPFAKAIWVRPQGRTLAGTSEELPSEYQDFEDVFNERIGEAALPEHKPWDHEIPIIEGKTPTHYGGLIPLSKKEEDFLKDYIEKHLEKKFIRPSSSPIAHGVLFAPKKDGTLRPCIDYRKLNEITRKNRYPLPRIDELQDRLLGAQWFTALDIRDAYYRIRMKEGEEWKTAFRTRWGLYEYQVMPFGLTNAPASFQELINNTLREYLDDFALAYLDDVLIFSKTYDEHVQHVRKVLEQLRQKDLPVKLSKCEFHKHSISFLGYIVSTEGLAPDPKKVAAIEEWPEPASVKDVQSFLGLLNYYRKFIGGFSQCAIPLSELTKKDMNFMFDDNCRDAFRSLKDKLTRAPILALFNPEQEAILETDASDRAIGAALTQKGDDGKTRPVAFYSRKMTEPELNYDIHDKELLAVVEAFREWRVYLEGTKYPVQVYTDHKNLLYWTTTKQLNRRQVRWSETLASYDFKINHVRGTENGRADALSRRPDYMTGTSLTPSSILKKDGNALVYRKPQTNVLALMDMKLSDSQKLAVIQERHDSKTAGHPGISKTIELITRDYTWPKMREYVTNYVKNCDTCAKAKHARHKPWGKLQSIAMPDQAWSSIALDFITKLPKSREPLTGVEFDSILVINDRLTKLAYFIPYKESSTAEELAYTFTKTIIAQHGVPQEIVSDRDKLFTSQFWQSLADLLGTKHKLSTSYHPQTDGQTERTNQTLEQYLRCYLNYEQDNWVQLLPVAQFAFNNNASATGVSPFFANYGFHPNLNRDPKGIKPIAEKANISVEKMKELHKMLKEELDFISKRTTEFANRKRSEGPDLKEGEMVYLLRKHIKTKRPSDKLDHTKLGPYKIKKKLGPVTFELDVPEGMRIHPLFHISLLEPAPRNARPGPTEIDEETQTPYYEVDKIIGYRLVSNKPHYLIHWKGYQHSEDTWEPEEHLTPDLVKEYHQGPAPPSCQSRPRKTGRLTSRPATRRAPGR